PGRNPGPFCFGLKNMLKNPVEAASSGHAKNVEIATAFVTSVPGLKYLAVISDALVKAQSVNQFGRLDLPRVAPDLV
ncbi:MAG: hypothetical protein ACO38Y_03230, partial [Steroidobacteraceae bacterium]